MEEKEIIFKFGPCGLLCEKCFAFSKGKIKEHSQELKNNLGSFEIYAERFVTLLNEPIFNNYPAFKALLDYFTQVECQGCREEKCKLFTNCKVKECTREHQVDFCYECDEFPCQKTGFDPNLEKRWLKINNRIKEIGILKYYEEVKELPRY
jgi:hypothetical protein